MILARECGADRKQACSALVGYFVFPRQRRPALQCVQIEAALGPLPPSLRRTPGRSQSAPAHQPWQAPCMPCAPADRGSARDQGREQGQAVTLTLDFRPRVVPRRAPLLSWAEALPPLGAELARVDRTAADLILRLLDHDPARCGQPLKTLQGPVT